MENETLSPEQIQHWRHIIAIQLEEKARMLGMTDGGYGIWAMIMPESEVIAYWQRMKKIVEAPQRQEPKKQLPRVIKKCDHSNSIKGSNGRYCIDCEKYI
jgi:hypothetical protein